MPKDSGADITHRRLGARLLEAIYPAWQNRLIKAGSVRSDGYEDRWFIEIDLSTESPSTIIGKCDRYRDYYRSGLEQKQFGVFPVVVWLVLDAGRRDRLRTAIQEAYPKGGKLFIIITADEFERLIRQGFDAKDLC